MLPEDAILLPEIVDEIFLVAIHPASQSQHEEVQSVGHGRRLHGSDAAVTHVVSRIHSSRPFSRTIRGRDRLPRVARAVLGRVEQEAERRRRQTGPPDCTCRPQIVAGGRAKLGAGA